MVSRYCLLLVITWQKKLFKNGYNLQKINGAYNDLELQLIETVDILDKYCIEKY